MQFRVLYYFLAIVFAVPLAFGLLIKGVDIYQEITWEPPPWPPSTERIQHPDHLRWGEAAVNRFNTFSTDQQTAMRLAITNNVSKLDEWVKSIESQHFDLLCIGETHDDYIRRFAAENIFNVLRYDVLLLEATPEKLADILRRIDAGESRVELLGADITYVIRAIRQANPEVEILGIEETDAQRERRQELLEGGRETSVENNLRKIYQPGKRYLALFGAFHCANTWNWLYYRLRQNPNELAGANTRSIRIIREHIEGPIEAFTYFLGEIGVIPKEHFVIMDNASLPPEIKEWFPFLQANELGISESMVIFRPKTKRL